MITTDQKKILLMAVLGVVWGGTLAWQWMTAEEPVRVPLTNVSGTAAVPRPRRATVSGLHVQLDLLAAMRNQREMTFTTSRNIFAPPRSENSAVTRINKPELDPGSEQAMRQQEVLVELAQFHYLGFVRMEEGWWKKGELAVLTKNDDVHVVKTGETVEGHVVVKAITKESVTLRDLQSRLEHTVLLSEEPPIQP